MSSPRFPHRSAPLRGIWVPLVTPLRDGEVDLNRLQLLADRIIKQGVHGLVVCGSTGEAAQLDLAEQGAALAAVLETAGKRCPVMMGISGADTYAAASKALRFDDLELAGYLVSTPCYVRPSQDGLRRHFEVIADATGQRIVLDNVPARSGVNLEPATARQLAERPQFAAIKEAGGDLQQISDLVEQTPLAVLCGDDALLFGALCAGGHGAISAAAHIRPDLYVQLYDLVRAGRLDAARALFRRLQPLIHLLYAEPNPAPLKAVLARQGLLRDELRLPLTPASAASRAGLACAVDALMALPSYPAESFRLPQVAAVGAM